MFKVSNRNTRKMSLDFKNNIKNFKTKSIAICRRNLSRTLSWKVFPRIYTTLQSNGNFLRNEKSLPRYLIHEKIKMSAFFISEKITLKMETFFKFLPYVQRALAHIMQFN